MASLIPPVDVPLDVWEWLHETYTDEGVTVWLAALATADDAGRARMLRIARTPSGGT